MIVTIGLVACGGDLNENNKKDNSIQPNDNTEEEVNNEATEENNEEATTETSDELSGAVTMWTASLAGDPFDSYFEDLANAFEKMHPDLEVVISDIPQGEIQQKVLTSLTGDDVLDLVNLAPRYTLNIASQGGLLDLEDLLSDEVKESYVKGPFESGYYCSTSKLIVL